MPPRDGNDDWGSAMQSVQQDTTNSMPLRQSSRSMGTLLIRFVGLLTIAVVAMTLIWSR